MQKNITINILIGRQETKYLLRFISKCLCIVWHKNVFFLKICVQAH